LPQTRTAIEAAPITAVALDNGAGLPASLGSSDSDFYFFLPDSRFGCHPTAEPFWLGAAAIVLIFSFLGFFFSRLLLCSPLATSTSLWLMNRLSLPSDYGLVIAGEQRLFTQKDAEP
jgi:hypothetical protein